MRFFLVFSCFGTEEDSWEGVGQVNKWKQSKGNCLIKRHKKSNSSKISLTDILSEVIEEDR